MDEGSWWFALAGLGGELGEELGGVFSDEYESSGTGPGSALGVPDTPQFGEHPEETAGVLPGLNPGGSLTLGPFAQGEGMAIVSDLDGDGVIDHATILAQDGRAHQFAARWAELTGLDAAPGERGVDNQKSTVEEGETRVKNASREAGPGGAHSRGGNAEPAWWWVPGGEPASPRRQEEDGAK